MCKHMWIGKLQYINLKIVSWQKLIKLIGLEDHIPFWSGKHHVDHYSLIAQKQNKTNPYIMSPWSRRSHDPPRHLSLAKVSFCLSVPEKLSQILSGSGLQRDLHCYLQVLRRRKLEGKVGGCWMKHYSSEKASSDWLHFRVYEAITI